MKNISKRNYQIKLNKPESVSKHHEAWYNPHEVTISSELDFGLNQHNQLGQYHPYKHLKNK